MVKAQNKFILIRFPDSISLRDFFFFQVGVPAETKLNLVDLGSV